MSIEKLPLPSLRGVDNPHIGQAVDTFTKAVQKDPKLLKDDGIYDLVVSGGYSRRRRTLLNHGWRPIEIQRLIQWEVGMATTRPKSPIPGQERGVTVNREMLFGFLKPGIPEQIPSPTTKALIKV